MTGARTPVANAIKASLRAATSTDAIAGVSYGPLQFGVVRKQHHPARHRSVTQGRRYPQRRNRGKCQHDALNRLDFSQRNGVTNLDLSYDLIGNITAKTSATNATENVGGYTYDPVRKHAVMAAGSNSYSYDANGAVISRNGSAISWYSYHLPQSIAGSGQSSQFFYTPDRQRWKQVATYPSSNETTIYIGGLLDKVTVTTGTAWRHYVPFGNGSAVFTRWSTGTNESRYLLNDHIGSVDTILASTGGILAKLSFSPFGARRGSNWLGTPSASEFSAIANASRDGFTGHEHLDNIGIVHMGGRIYDPVVGRFLQADPLVQDPEYSQSLNRYAYVWNNPLSLTDPSGFATTSPDGGSGNDPGDFYVNYGEGSSGGGWGLTWDTWQRILGFSPPRPPASAIAGASAQQGTGACTMSNSGPGCWGISFKPWISEEDFYSLDLPSAPQWSVDLSTGIGDQFGAKVLRELLGIDGGVNYNSPVYRAGEVIGTGISVVEGGAVASATVKAGAGLLGRLAARRTARAGIGALDEASEAAFRASRGPISISRKHFPGAGGRYSKFADGVDIDATVREALRAPGAVVRPNQNADGVLIPGYRVYTDLGRTVGTKGETGIRTIVSPDGRVITSFPGKPW